MSEGNKNEVSDLEKKWMREFDNKFSSQWSSETDNCGEYISGSRAIAWQVYLSARKSAEVEIDGYLKAANMTIERLRNKLKDRDQEIERLKAARRISTDTNQIFYDQLKKQLKEREEMIREAIPYAHKMLWDARTGGFPEDVKEYEVWLEKAHKLVGLK